MHHMITTKQIVTNRQNVMEGAGEQEKSDHTDEREDDNPMVFFHYCKYCVHFKPPLI